jgi:hypothetical protein
MHTLPQVGVAALQSAVHSSQKSASSPGPGRRICSKVENDEKTQCFRNSINGSLKFREFYPPTE